MNDLISRQAAIDALMKRDKALRNINWYDKPFAEGECKGIDDALEIINALPSAQPEITPDGTLNVSINTDVTKVGRISEEREPLWKYCPNCGAKMGEGEQDK